jgi:hypothetical protein
MSRKRGETLRLGSGRAMGHPHPILIAQPVLTFHNLPQRREKAVDFFGGVVVDEADAE